MLFVIRLALELEAAGELNYALCTAGRERTSDTSEVGAVDIQGSKLRREEIRPVENVEGLETKLESGALRDPDVLDQRSIPVHIERSIDERALHASGLSRRDVEEHLARESSFTKTT